ncbi:MAG: arylesterase [Akkermansiaceae bacterium]
MISAFSQTASSIISLICFTLLTISPQQTHAQDQPPTTDTPNRRIIFLGDSITAGLGLQKSQAYPALIQNLAKQQNLNWTCINAGLSGDTTNGGVRRVKLLTKRPLDLIIIALGGNDGLRGIAPAVTQQNLLTIINTIQTNQPKAKIILAGIEVPANMGTDYKTKFLTTFQQVADKTKVPLYPSLIKGISGDPKLNQPDLIHPNQQGQQIIATNLFKKIQSTLTQ